MPPPTDRARPDISPLHANLFRGLPPACVITTGFDVFRDEGIAYVEALRAAGVPVKHVHEPAMLRARRWRALRAGALAFACVEPRFDGVDNHRGERDFLIEGVLAYALVKID
jgi:acetyl esterase/lipase